MRSLLAVVFEDEAKANEAKEALLARVKKSYDTAKNGFVPRLLLRK